jgi:hypothetical protein
MLLWLAIFGGLLLMMGSHSRFESQFYCFRLEDQLRESHLLRLIDMHIDFSFVREKLKDGYSETGRPLIDPELLLRILLIGYLSGASNECKLVEESRMHLAWRSFTGWALIRRFVPDEDSEALRELVGVSEAAKQDQVRAQHRLGEFLLRSPSGMRPSRRSI